MLGTIKKSLSNLSKLSGGVYMDEEPKSEASGTKSESKSKPKMDSDSAPPAFPCNGQREQDLRRSFERGQKGKIRG